MQRLTAVSLMLLATCAICWADSSIKSGPQPGESIPGPFHFQNINGKHAGNPHCLVCEYGLRPVVLVFSREVPTANNPQPLTSLLKGLDAAVGRNVMARLRSFTVFLSADYTSNDSRPALISTLDGLATSLDLKNTVLAAGPAAGPDKYHVNAEAGITVILYKEQKVAANFSYAPGKMAEADVKSILAAVEKLAGGKR